MGPVLFSFFLFSIQIRIFVQSGPNLFLNPDQNFCVFQFPVVVGGGPYALMLWVAVPSLLILILNLVGGGPYAIYCSYCGWRSLRSDFLCFTKSENQLPSMCVVYVIFPTKMQLFGHWLPHFILKRIKIELCFCYSFAHVSITNLVKYNSEAGRTWLRGKL